DARDAALVLAACEKEAGQRDTNGFTALMGAVQHRNTDLARLLLRREAGVQRGAAAIHIAVFLEDAALVKMLCPYEKELQLADGRTAHMIAAALNNPALHAVFEEPKRKRARSRAQGSTRGR
ncbi:Serine/threonine protein kinase, partial [Giardia duodenalis]